MSEQQETAPSLETLRTLYPASSTAEALRRWRADSKDLSKEIQRQQRIDDARKRLKATPKPKKWPATLDDFYRLIVKGKDKATNQYRFKKFLAAQLPPLSEAKQLDAIEERLKNYQSAEFGASVWDWIASEYLRWWGKYKTESKQRAGRARHKK